jgi:hypothetical protein
MAKYRFTAAGTKISLPILDSVKFIKAVIKKLEIEHRQAVRVWLRKVLENTPTYTGTARGTYKPLGRILNVAVRPGSIKQRAKQKLFITYRDKKFRTGFAEGANYSEYSMSIAGSDKKITYTFTFTHKLPYILWNEMFSAPPGFTLPSNPPWFALKQAEEAFFEYVFTIPSRLPKLKFDVKIIKL